MSLINRLATQTSSGYKSFISLFKYKLLLMALLLLGATSSFGALPNAGDLNIGGKKGTKDADHPIKLDVAATEVTNTIPHSSSDDFQLTDSLISHVDSTKVLNAAIDPDKSVLYIGVMKDKGVVYGVDKYTSNIFDIDVKGDQSVSLGVLLNQAAVSGTIASLNLKSIEVYPKLAGGLKINNSVGKAVDASVLTLKDGLHIHKGAEIGGDGLAIESDTNKLLTLKADIINDGIIKVGTGKTAVSIAGKSTSIAFPLESTDTASGAITAAKFINSGLIEGETAISLSSQVANALTTDFDLTNKKGGVIKGKVINTGATLGLNLINHGEMVVPCAGASTYNALALESYEGKGSITIKGITANNVATGTAKPAITVTKDAEFTGGGQLILQTSAVAITKKVSLCIVKASGSDGIKGFDVNKQLFCQLYKSGGKGYIITNGSATVANKSILINDATSTVLDETATYFFPEKPMKLTEVAANLANAYKKVDIIGEVSATEFAGIKFVDAMHIVEDVYLTASLNTVLDSADADDLVDLLMPDSSNSALNASSKVTSKVFDHIGSRIASRNINFSHKKGVTAVNSGEVADNLSMWSSVGYAGSSQKKTDDNQDYSELSGFVFNVGLDTNLNNDMVIGGCYGFSNNTATIHGAHNKTKKAENKVMSHIFSGYASFNFDHVADANFAVMFGISKNDYKEVIGVPNKDKYDSTMFGFNAGVVYPVELKQRSIDVLGQIGIVNVNSKEHNNKYGKKTPKQSNTLINLGLGSAFKDTTVVGDDMPLHYSLGVMMKLALTTGDKDSTIVFDAKTAANNLKVKNRKADVFSINCNTGLNLQAHKNLDVNFDFDFGLGFAPLTVSYGIGAGLRYKF